MKNTIVRNREVPEHEAMRAPGLLLLLPALAFLGGCADEVYYSTRYQPTDIDSLYSSESQATWGGDKEVYELPAAPPDLDDVSPSRKDCAYPYQKMIPQQMIGFSQRGNAGHPENPLVPLSRLSDQERPSGPIVQREDAHFGTNSAPDHSGLPAHIPLQPIGKTNDEPKVETGTGTQTSEKVPLVGWGNLNNPYCCGAGHLPRKPVAATPAKTDPDAPPGPAAAGGAPGAGAPPADQANPAK